MLSISDNSSVTILLILSFHPRKMADSLQRKKARLVCTFFFVRSEVTFARMYNTLNYCMDLD